MSSDKSYQRFLTINRRKVSVIAILFFTHHLSASIFIGFINYSSVRVFRILEVFWFIYILQNLVNLFVKETKPTDYIII